MNDLLYDLVDVRLLADRGTLVPVRITAETPIILIAEEAIIVSDSSIEYHVGKKQFLLLLEEQDVVEIAPNSGDKLGNVHGIYFRSYRLARKDKKNLQYEASTEHLPEHGHVQSISRRASDGLLELLELTGSPPNALHSPKAGLMLHRLMEMFFSRELPQPDFMTRNGAIKRAVAYIDNRYAEPLTRDMAAQMSGFNESYFSSLFRKETGWSFGEYLNRVRIDEAKRRLLGTSEKISDIAYQTGFADASYFGKAFQKIVGMSPGSFRTLAGSERVASMQFYGAMLAAGLAPIAGVREILRSSLLLANELAEMAVMEEMDHVEVLEGAKPDMILAPAYYYSYPEVVRALERIAPVVMLPWGVMDKPEEVRAVGRLLGRLAQAESWVLSFREKAMAAKRRVAQIVGPEETAAIYELWHDRQWMLPHWPVRSVYNLYAVLGLKPPERVKEEVLDPNVPGKIGEDELPDYSANHMFLIVPHDDAESYRAKLMQRDVWQFLVRERGCRLHLLSLNQFWMDDGLSLEKQLAIIVSKLSQGTDVWQ